MRVSRRDAARDEGYRPKRRRSHVMVLGVAVLAVVLGIMVFAGVAMAAPAAGDKYAGAPADSKAVSPIGALYQALAAGKAVPITVSGQDVSAASGSISGKVTNSSGTGLANVFVVAANEAGDELPYAVTSSTGAYTISGLPNEPVVLFTFNGGNYIDEWYNNIPVPGHLNAEGATWLDLAATPTRTGINFSLAVGKSISGYVHNSAGNGLGGVELDVCDLSGNLVFQGQSNDNGTYSIKGLPAAKYRLATADDTGYINIWYGNDPVITDPSGASSTAINISSSSTTSKNFVLANGHTISGTVTATGGGALSDVYVRVQASTGVGGGFYALTDGSGYYEAYGLPATTYKIYTANELGYVDEWYNNDPAPTDFTGASAASVDASSDPTSINFALDKGYTISGTVTDNVGGGALSGIEYVDVYNGSNQLVAYQYVGGDYGTSYTTWAVPAGTYYVRTFDRYGAGYIDEWYNNKPVGVYDRAGSDPVLLSASNATGINFGLDHLTRYEQTDAHIYYTPAWTVVTSASSSGGSYSYSAATSAVATIYFNGTRLDASIMMGTTTGKADFWVDNVKTDTIDLAATAPHYNVKIFTTGDLPTGPHKVEIKYNSTNASGKRITLDAVDVAGSLTYAVPMVTAVTPNNGFTLGGDTVVITGANFTGATGVTFGGVAATGVTVNSPTQITAVTPARGAAGTVDVLVTTPAGTTATTAADQFTYAVPGTPTITSLSPSSGSVGGGTTVVINGTNFAALTGDSAVTFGGVNATSYHVDSGTKITAVAPAHAEGAVRVQVTAFGGTTADTLADDFTYTTITRYDQLNNLDIVKTGTWADYASPLSYGLSYGRSSTAGASATIWFNGTQLDYIAFEGTTTGKADIYVDGVKVTGSTPVDLYASPVKYQQKVWSTGVLTSGLHSVKIVRSASSASGKYLTLDAVDIYGTIAPPPVRYEQTNSNIHKVGNWTDYSNSTASGSSYGRTLTADATATINFTGSRIDYIGFKGTTTGWVEVYLDGDLKATIDLVATTAAGNQLIWSSGTIDNTTHTLVIKRSATSLATEYLTLDAVDIWGAIAP